MNSSFPGTVLTISLAISLETVAQWRVVDREIVDRLALRWRAAAMTLELAAVVIVLATGATIAYVVLSAGYTGKPIAEGDQQGIIAYDRQGVAVAGVTAWSVGPGRSGLLEPMGVHADHRHRGYGRAICIAAAGALQGLGSSSATVCTPSANVVAIATYASAGFRPQLERRDQARGA